MIPAEFEYTVPETLQDAITASSTAARMPSCWPEATPCSR